MTAASRVRVLCVDDEPQVLEGLRLHLRREYEVHTALGPREALEALGQGDEVAVIVSDMRMPGMDGASLLAHVRTVSPCTVRVLLTGHAEIDAAIAAVNEGQVFRFLTKPCPPRTLLAAVAASAEQYRLLTSERVLLEQTLHGCIQALTDVLALANPTAFGRALRIRRHVTALADHLALADRWQLDVAAMLSQIGLITLPPDTIEKLHDGHSLSQDELSLVGRTPAVADQLLAHIPRLDTIRAILANARKPFWPLSSDQPMGDSLARVGGHVLRVATDFDGLEGSGLRAAESIGTMRARSGVYDPALLNAMEAVHSSREERTEIREVRLADLRRGMVCAEDVRLSTGTLLVARGYEVSDRFVERVANFPPRSVAEPIRIIMARRAVIGTC